MLSETPGKRLNKYVSDYCVFDLETTGISPNFDSVIEISAVKVKDGKVVDEFTSLVNPLRPIPFGASQVNGITNDMVADAPVFETVLKNFIDFAGDMVLVGHNIHSFDMKFIYRDVKRYWDRTIDNDYIDTLYLSRAYLPQLRHHTLSDLSMFYGISTAGAHRALNDCRMNQQVFEKLGQKMNNPSDTEGALPICPRCGDVLKKRNGKFGEFWGCGSFPKCRFTQNV